MSETILGALVLVGALACEPPEIRLFQWESVDAGGGAAPGVGIADATVSDIRVNDAAVRPPAALDAAPDCPRGALGQCVDCLNNSHCAGATPACDTVNNLCVECFSDDDCGGARRYCDVENTLTCNECVNAGQCRAGEQCLREDDEPEEGLHCED